MVRFASFVLLLFLALRPAWAQSPASDANPPDFQTWLQAFRQDAMGQGITPQTLDLAFAGVAPVPHILDLDRQQPETVLTFAQYIDRIVSPARRDAMRTKYAENKPLLDAVGQRFGVQPRFIVALWGIETDFGRNIGTYPAVTALTTLAYDGRRSAFFRHELINALLIIQNDNIDPSTMLGSWAGAMGQSQFMPSSFLKFAVSYRGNGAPDIWRRTDDVFASIANYLASSGWHRDQSWGDAITLPPGFDPALVGLPVKKTVADWAHLGVRRADGKALRAAQFDQPAAIVQPGGSDGPSFLVYDNFTILMRWNSSTYFAIAVGYLADSVK